MAKKPLLLFPSASSSTRDTLPTFMGNNRYPEKGRQIQLLENRISDLSQVLANQTAYLGTNPSNFISEMILVLEVAGDLKDFFRAVAKTPGMEFLCEMQEEISPDENFYSVNKHQQRLDTPLSTRLFLTMTNQRALNELRSYWREYKKSQDEQNFSRGTSKFRTLFEKLKDLRPYTVADRIRDTGMENYLDEMRQLNQNQRVKFEIELAFKNNTVKDSRAFAEVSQLIEENDGVVIQESRIILSEIGYHAFIADAPIECFSDLTENTNVTFLKSQQVLFFRPVGQAIFTPGGEVTLQEYAHDAPPIVIGGNPVVALLDGLPLENHSLLNNRLIIDDPDDYGRNYLSQNRIHGTAMSSLILNGDLSNPLSLTRPIYVRPILKPLANNLTGGEFLPDDRLPIDIIHRAVKRIFEGEEGNPPTAPSVKIINFSIGDPFRPFHRNISTWAKALDWLSYKYNVLFVISAGNKTDDITLDIAHADFDATNPQEIQTATLKRIIENNFDRKILTPAESINSITVGAAHTDDHGSYNFPQRRNLLTNSFLLSPISRIGFGYNNSIKPDILMPGRRKLFRKHVIQPDISRTFLRLEENESIVHPPGNLAALPGPTGEINRVGYITGTSGAAALTSHLASRLYEMLLELNVELPLERRIPSKFFTVVIKALLVHGSSWGEAQSILADIIRNQPGVSTQTIKKNIFPYLGYGCVNVEKVIYCTDQRVTLIGFGELTCRQGTNAHIYSFPLPPSLGQINIHKRLAITLAWLSPLNFSTAQYRRAHLFFDNLEENGYLELKRDSHDYKLGKKGTVQHDVLSGEYADVFQDGDMINIKVSCREDASGLSVRDRIPYAITVTLEIRENVTTQIYEEVRLRLQERIRGLV